MQRRRILLAIACVPLLQCATATPPPEPEPIATPLPPPPPPPEPEPEPQPEPIAIAPIVEPPPPEPPPPPPPPRHYKALIIGDSMAATDFGVALEKQLDAHRYISCVRWGKSATGLARPDYFDWMRAG